MIPLFYRQKLVLQLNKVLQLGVNTTTRASTTTRRFNPRFTRLSPYVLITVLWGGVTHVVGYSAVGCHDPGGRVHCCGVRDPGGRVQCSGVP